MWMFARLTVGVALALVAFFVVLFMIKVLFVAAIVAIAIIGVAAMASFFRRRSQLIAGRRSDIVQRY